MPGWACLLGTLAYNFARHRRGKPTICAVTRRYTPRWAFLAGWAALTAWIIPHIWRGYPRDRPPR